MAVRRCYIVQLKKVVSFVALKTKNEHKRAIKSGTATYAVQVEVVGDIEEACDVTHGAPEMCERHFQYGTKQCANH